MFASRAVVPTDADLAPYATHTYTMCIYNDGACNDIVLTGTYSGWSSTVDDLETFQPVTGFEGWYVVTFEDDTDPSAEGGVQAKPVQLDGSGNFSWDYQLGADAELIRGTADILPGNTNEVDIKNIGAGIVVIDVKSWKHDPCLFVYHVYNFTLVSPDCNDEGDYVVPAISGGFNNWAQEAMTMNELKTAQRQQAGLPGAVFEYSARAAEGAEFKFRSSEEWGKDWTNQLKVYVDSLDEWVAFNGGANLVLGEVTNIEYDLGDPELYSWDNCEMPEEYDEQEFDYTITVANAPVCGEAILAVIGGFEVCSWTVYNAVEVVNGVATLQAWNTDEFRFVDKMLGWSNEVIGFAQTTFHNADIADGVEDGVISIDLADAYFALCDPQSIATITDGSNHSQGYIRGTGTHDIGTTLSITAVPNHGYHFTQWLDSVTDNPRSITLTQDTTFTALFEKNPVPYLYCDSTMGYVYYRSFADSFPDMPKAYEYYEIFAEPYNGHHFVTWSDGNLEQTYRIIHITHDTVISATFAKNQYEVRTMPNYLSYGSTKGDTLVYYGDSVTIEATPNYGYHFGYWELGVYNYYGWQDTTSTNPVTIAIGENRICTAIFWLNTYRVICSSTDPEQGTVTADKRWADYLDSVHVTATPNYGYHFVRWTDGNTENPRRFFITQDTTFTAVFAIDRTGTCGDNMALNWQYDPTSYLLTISGNGTLNSNFTFGAEAPTQVQKLVVAEGVTTIGNSAFANYATLQEISLPTTLRTIYEQAFYNCVGLTHIYNFRERPCVAYSNTFDGIDKFDCTLHVLAESESMYRAATGWRDFYYIQTMEAGTVTVPEDTVIVEPTVNTVTFTWPVEENAASYTIEIYKEGVLVCTLIFNANGQLTGIAFAAPLREKHSHAPAALMTANGMQFTVTGLEGGTNYTYSVITKDAEEEVVASYEGEFTTVSQVPTAIDNVDASTAPRKLLHNGQILILRGDKTYTLTGQEVQ